MHEVAISQATGPGDPETPRQQEGCPPAEGWAIMPIDKCEAFGTLIDPACPTQETPVSL